MDVMDDNLILQSQQLSQQHHTIIHHTVRNITIFCLFASYKKIILSARYKIVQRFLPTIQIEISTINLIWLSKIPCVQKDTPLTDDDDTKRTKLRLLNFLKRYAKKEISTCTKTKDRNELKFI